MSAEPHALVTEMDLPLPRDEVFAFVESAGGTVIGELLLH